jgi:cobalt-zinc-cadmium efflux system outer membrane protein
VVATAGRRVAAGRSSQAELSRARVTVAETRIERLTLTTERARLHRELALLTGRAAPAGLFRLQGTMEPLPTAPSPQQLSSLLAGAPAAERAALNRALADAQLRLAEAQRRPDVSFGAGVRNLAATDDVALVFSGSIPLGTARRARSGIAAARAELVRADALAQASERALSAEAQGLADTLQLIHQEIELLRGVAVPESQRAAELLTRGYELGRFSYLEVADAQRQSINAARTLTELALRYHQTMLELGRLLGRPQPAEGPQS